MQNRRDDLLASVAAPVESAVPFPRLLVVLAHPDDEVLALGGRLERLSDSRLLTITDGAPLDGRDARHHGFASVDAYRAARRAELHAALAEAGLSPEVAPPIPQAVADQTAARHLPQLARAMAKEIAAFAPEAVLTHPYEGGHPDHDACAFAVHAAMRLLAGGDAEARGDGQPSPTPVLLEASSYHAGPDGSMQTSSFLEPERTSVVTCKLSPGEQARKKARLACFASQSETLAQFGTERELFRLAPAYDFTCPPHDGTLFYESFPWGMSGDRFCKLARAAIETLSLSPAADEDVAPGTVAHP